MKKNIGKVLIKYVIIGIVWFLIALSIDLFIVSKYNYSFKDVLFVEGLVFIGIGFCGSLGGNSNGLSLQGLGNMNAQYVSNANLETIKYEREKSNYNLKDTLKISLSTNGLILGGIFCILTCLII